MMTFTFTKITAAIKLVFGIKYEIPDLVSRVVIPAPPKIHDKNTVYEVIVSKKSTTAGTLILRGEDEKVEFTMNGEPFENYKIKAIAGFNNVN